MALPQRHPLNEVTYTAYTSSLGATPKVAYIRVPKKGRIIKVSCIQDGGVTGTAAVAVAINGGTAISSAALSVTGGSAGTLFSADVNTIDAADVVEDDVISLTPSGATGTVAGFFSVIIRH